MLRVRFLSSSYIGYKDVTKVVTESKLKIVLIEDSQALDEVVVVGNGTQKKGSVTGSVTSVDAKAIEDFPSANLSSALAGRLSGVYITREQVNRELQPLSVYVLKVL